MAPDVARIIELREYEPLLCSSDVISTEASERLWLEYGAKIDVEFPSPRTGGRYRITPLGWVGQIPLSPDLHLAILPKIPLANVFRMFEYAYRLKGFGFLDGLVGCASLAEFYENLAMVLARRVLKRARRGLHKVYLTESEQLPFVRGRLDIGETLRLPWRTVMPCSYEEHTPDHDDNRILLWTLDRILHSGLCSGRTQPTVRTAYLALHGAVGTHPVAARECIGRFYHRLNEDYEPTHALCRFFLEQSGPTHHVGDRAMVPFLVDMASLYELFVAEWLRTHLNSRFALRTQEKVDITAEGTVRFSIDLVLYDAVTAEALCVLDTKYKAATQPDNADIFQVNTYAAAKRCKEAVLIYPQQLGQHFDTKIGDVRIRGLVFALDNDLEQAGQEILASLP